MPEIASFPPSFHRSFAVFLEQQKGYVGGVGWVVLTYDFVDFANVENGSASSSWSSFFNMWTFTIFFRLIRKFDLFTAPNQNLLYDSPFFYYMTHSVTVRNYTAWDTTQHLNARVTLFCVNYSKITYCSKSVTFKSNVA